MKAKHHRAVSQIAQCLQGLLVIKLFIVGISLGAVDLTNDMNEAWIITYKVLGNLLYISIALLLLEFVRRYSKHMYRVTRAKEKCAQRTDIQESAEEKIS